MLVHARFTEPLRIWFTSWVTLNSPRYVVAEEYGVKNEGKHYHTCFETELGLDSIKKKFCQAAKDQGLQVAKGKANAYYGAVKECTDASYILKEGNIVLHHGYLEQTIKDLIEEGKQKFRRQLAPIVASTTPAVGPTVVVVKKSRMTITERLCHHAEHDLKWTRDGHWTLSHYEARICQKECAKHMTQYLRAKFNDPQAVVYLRNLMYEFADADLKEYLESRFTSNALNSV